MKILIVDDERTSRIRIAKIVESLGFVVVLASDGIRAMTIFEDNPDIKCIVTDCQMPNLDGPGLVNKIRALGIRIPILIYSAYRSVKEIAALLDNGADAFLSYPVNREDIGDYLDRYLFKLVEGNPISHET